MLTHYAISGPGAPTGNIIMATVENRYQGKNPGVPSTPYLLLVQVLDREGFTEMTRVVGINKQTRNRLDQQAVPFLETTAHIEEWLNKHFKTVWEQVHQCFDQGYDSKPLSALIH